MAAKNRKMTNDEFRFLCRVCPDFYNMFYNPDEYKKKLELIQNVIQERHKELELKLKGEEERSL